MFMLHINLKGITKCSRVVAKYFARRPLATPTLGMWSVGQNLTFLEHGHVAYQLKGNQEMQQHGSKYFARKHPRPWGWGQ